MKERNCHRPMGDEVDFDSAAFEDDAVSVIYWPQQSQIPPSRMKIANLGLTLTGTANAYFNSSVVFFLQYAPTEANDFTKE